MALYPPILTPTHAFTPAKPIPSSSTSNPLILRTPCLILRLHSPTLSSSTTLSSKPISQISLATPLRASSPQKYVYPDPIPEFAEAVSTYIYIYICMFRIVYVVVYIFMFYYCRRYGSSELSFRGSFWKTRTHSGKNLMRS